MKLKRLPLRGLLFLFVLTVAFPFFRYLSLFGQSKPPAFTLFRFLPLLGVMQASCFYPFSFPYTIWGNPGLLLLPFFVSSHYLGESRPPAFTLFRFLPLFGGIQASCFYPFSFPYTVWGNAGLLLLPFFVSYHLFATMQVSCFTVFQQLSLHRAMQP
jgi:hypothetical protein